MERFEGRKLLRRFEDDFTGRVLALWRWFWIVSCMACQLVICSCTVCILWLNSQWNFIFILLHLFQLLESRLYITLGLEHECFPSCESKRMRVVVWSDWSAEERSLVALFSLNWWRWDLSILGTRCGRHYNVVISDICKRSHHVLSA